eukprot:jgi/Psemu1/43980/gm1.43980_g
MALVLHPISSYTPDAKESINQQTTNSQQRNPEHSAACARKLIAPTAGNPPGWGVACTFKRPWKKSPLKNAVPIGRW